MLSGEAAANGSCRRQSARWIVDITQLIHAPASRGLFSLLNTISSSVFNYFVRLLLAALRNVFATSSRKF